MQLFPENQREARFSVVEKMCASESDLGHQFFLLWLYEVVTFIADNEGNKTFEVLWLELATTAG